MLELKNITKVYKPKRGQPVIALNDVSMKIQEKGLVFILGKSGSGKSTFLNVLGGLDKYDSGEIIIKGKSSKDFKQNEFDSYRNTYLGFIFQEYNILEEFNVASNIGLALELQGKKAANETINAILDEVDLVGYGTRKPSELSGGQKQRVAIARALVKNPEIIMADEPTGALDSKTGIQVFDTLKKLSRDKLVLVVSHDREFAELYADRIIEFSDGKIISDTEKHKIEAQIKSSGISVVDDSIIHIKQGYQLTKEDIKIINKYLESNNNDKIISLDSATNRNIKKYAKIDDAGNREKFKDTNQDRIIPPVNEEFTMIKSKLPFKKAIRIGANGLKTKPIRLCITILLSLISFAMFGLADTLGSYNKQEATVQSIKDTNINNISFSKAKKVYYNSGNPEEYFYRQTKMDENDIKKLSDDLEIDFKGIYSKDSSANAYSINSNIENPSKISSSWASYYLQIINGFGEYNEAELEKLGFTITGTYPQSFDEIAISRYTYDHFKVAGYVGNNGDIKITAENMTTIEAFLFKKPTLDLGGKVYKITAVIDTKIDEQRYEQLKNISEYSNDFIIYILYSELRTIIEYGYHAIAYVKDGFIDNEIAQNGKYGLHNSYDTYLVYSNRSSGSTPYYTHYMPNNINTFSKVKDLKYIWFNGAKNELAEGEVILPINVLFNTQYVNQNGFMEYLNDNIKVRTEDIPDEMKANPKGFNFESYYDLKVYEAVEKYAKDSLNEALENGFKNNDTNTSDYEAYLSYLSFKGKEYNGYAEKSMKIITYEVLASIVADYESKGEDILSVLEQVFDNILYEYYDGGIYGNYQNTKVVGLYIPTQDYYTKTLIGNDNYFVSEVNMAIVPDELYDIFAIIQGGIYAFAISQIPTDNVLRETVAYYYKQDGLDFSYQMQNAVTYMLNQVNNFIEGAAQVFLYVGIGLAVFASLMLLNFIATSIAYKKREIGILRAVGARSKDVFSIFFSESLIIALINFTLAVIVAVIGIILIKNMLRNDYGLLITILNFGIRQIILMLFISIGVAFISSFFPVYKTAIKRPIDAISNR